MIRGSLSAQKVASGMKMAKMFKSNFDENNSNPFSLSDAGFMFNKTIGKEYVCRT